MRLRYSPSAHPANRSTAITPGPRRLEERARPRLPGGVGKAKLVPAGLLLLGDGQRGSSMRFPSAARERPLHARQPASSSRTDTINKRFMDRLPPAGSAA